MKNKLHDFANWFFVGMLAVLFICCFLTQEIYSATNRYASLAAFAALFFLLLGNTNPIELLKKKDAEFLIMCITDAAAFVFLFVIHSHKGAILTVVNFLMVLYLSDKVRFSRIQIFWMTLCGGLLLIPWFGLVKWDYNYNMVGLIFVTIVILSLMLLELLKEKYKLFYLFHVQCLLYVTGTLFTILYHSRCAIVGMLLFGLIFLLSPKICGCKIVYRVVVLAATIGSILFTLLYVALGNLDMELVILYKNILSGREDIWGELWTALLQKPLTGIGSAYQMKSFFIFEVHNGLFDILVVHGVLVFTVVIWFLLRRLFGSFRSGNSGNIQKIANAGVFAILFTSFFENFVIVPPYLLVFFMLLTLIVPSTPVTCTNGGNLI